MKISLREAEKLAKHLGNFPSVSEKVDELIKILKGDYEFEFIPEKVVSCNEIVGILAYYFPNLIKCVSVFVCPECYRPCKSATQVDVMQVRRIPSGEQGGTANFIYGVADWAVWDWYYDMEHAYSDEDHTVSTIPPSIIYSSKDELFEAFIEAYYLVNPEGHEREAVEAFQKVKDEYIRFFREKTGGELCGRK